MNYEKESEVLKAIAHPVRLKIVKRLSGAECNVNKMVKALGLPQSTVSQHLAILKNRGVIISRKDGTRTCYYVQDPKIKKIIDILEK